MISLSPSLRTSLRLALLGVIPASVGGQAPAVHHLDTPDAVAPDVFSLIQGLRELSDGRVVVTDWIEERLVVVDLVAGTTSDYGAVGGGPKEFRLPRQLLALRGDSTLLVDVGNSRLTVLDPEMNFVRSLSMYAHGERFAMNPRAVDTQGALYFATASFTPLGRRDSVPVASWTPGHDRMRVLAAAQVKTSTSRQRRVSLRPGMPYVAFAKQDSWAVAHDGWLAVVRSEPYRVEWYGPTGEEVIGPSIEYEALPVTMPDRRDHVRRWLMSTTQSGRGDDGGVGHVPADAQAEREINRMARSEEFADVFPPFEPGRVWASTDGLLWVQRSLPVNSAPTFDVFDRRGSRIGEVTLPAGRRLLGLGHGTLYATIADADDLLSLERYQAPSFGSR